MRRSITIVAIAVGIFTTTAEAAYAQEEPPVANCGFLSAVICQTNIPVGPIEFFPNGLNPGQPVPTLPPLPVV